MKDLSKLYKIMFQRWLHVILGLVMTMLFAVFSGVSILMIIPLLDNVFVADRPPIVYQNFGEFWSEIIRQVNLFIVESGSIGQLVAEEHYKPLLESLSQVMQQSNPVMLLWTIAILFSVLTLIKNILFFGQKAIYGYLQGYTVRELRNQMYHKYLYQSLAFFNKNKTGDSLVRMVNDVQIINLMFIDSMFRALQDIFLILVYLVTALSINAKLLLIALLILPLFSWLVSLIGTKVKKYARRIQNQISQLFSYVEEVLSNIRIVKAFSHEDREYDRFKEINHKHFSYWFKSKLYGLLNTPLSEMNSVVIGAFVLVVGGKQVLAPGSVFTFGNFMAFLFAIFSMLHPVKNLTKTYANFRKALVSLDRISEILNNRSEILDLPDAVSKKEFLAQIEFKDVSFSYNGSDQVLKNLNFVINKGENIALVGSSGSGKTTITNLLTRMYDTSSGEILIDDISVKNIKVRELRQLFGTVTQESMLFSDTVFNNIAYGSPVKVSAENIERSAHIANADEFIEKMPQKYQTLLDVRAGNLSGGQKQRLCIARSVVGDPPILIFDEATSALDTEAEKKVQKAIEQATKDRTVIMIAHRLSTILNSDKIIVMHDGQIVGMGNHAQLLKSNPRYQTLYQLQFEDNFSS